MRDVELWENERWAPGPSLSSSFSTQDDLDAVGLEFDVGDGSGSALLGAGAGMWSNTNLRPADRAPRTRARDGWSGVGGEVSNLTFSLAPGWAFVETEGWRPDTLGSWVSASGSNSCSASGSGDPTFGADDNKFYASLSYDTLSLIAIDSQTAGCTQMMYGQIHVVYLLGAGITMEGVRRDLKGMFAIEFLTRDSLSGPYLKH
ncbi:hypothetical protein BDR06DRAFT_1015363 [Suillus hirtellus]|nr:hypothetical protein BDR06DRAFT_1015363 [Suillus hirtellus]